MKQFAYSQFKTLVFAHAQCIVSVQLHAYDAVCVDTAMQGTVN